MTLERLVLSDIKKFRSKKSFFSSGIWLLTLASCGGGGSNGNDTSDISSTVVSGNVIKGPLYDVLVFLDLDGDGEFDTREPHDFSDLTGRYYFETDNSIADVVVLGQGSSLDTSSGSSAANIRLIGKTTEQIISPLTTMISIGDIQSEDLANSLSLQGIDILAANPYDGSLPSEQALALEKANHQILNLIEAVSTVALSGDLTEHKSFKLAFEILSDVIETEAASGQAITIQSEHFTDNLKNVSEDTLRNLVNFNEEVLTEKLNQSLMAAQNVNTVIGNVTDLIGDDAKGAFSLSQLLSDQLREANLLGGDLLLESAVEAEVQANNLAPNNISLSNYSVHDGATDLTVGELSADDEGYIDFSLLGEDAAYFSITNNTTLVLNNVPDYEVNDSYAITIKATDSSGKSSVQKFSLVVEKLNGGNATEDIVTVTSGNIHIVKTDAGDDLVVKFYINELNPSNAINSFDLTVKYDTSGVDLVATETNSNFIGATNANNDIVYVAGISLSGSPIDEEILSMQFTDIDDGKHFDLEITDLIVNGGMLEGASFMIA